MNPPPSEDGVYTPYFTVEQGAGSMVIKPQQGAVIFIRRDKGGQFVSDVSKRFRFRQHIRKPRRAVGETSLKNFRSQELLSALVHHVAAEIPKRFCELCTLVAVNLGELYVCHVFALFKKLTDTLGGVMPRDNLCVLDIPRRRALRKMDTVLGIPCGHIAVSCKKTAAAAILGFQKVSYLVERLALFEFGADAETAVVSVTSETQNMVDFVLLK